MAPALHRLRRRHMQSSGYGDEIPDWDVVQTFVVQLYVDKTAAVDGTVPSRNVPNRTRRDIRLRMLRLKVEIL